MRILAIETTSFTGSLALFEEDTLLAECQLPSQQRSAQSLAPTLQKFLAEQHCELSQLQLIAVAQGPGSFTGLRVGITTAKSLAYALGAEVLGVDTLAVLAHQAASGIAGQTAGRWHAILDAQRNQLFAATFSRDSATAELRCISPTQIVDLAPWLEQLCPGDYVVGPVLGKIAAQIPAGITCVDQSLWEPQAASVGHLAWQEYSAGRRDDLWKLAPHYHRLSAAEEKAAQVRINL